MGATRPIAAIARVEGGQMLRHPAFLLGLVVIVTAILSTSQQSWATDGYFSGFLQGTIVCLGLGTLIAAAAAAGRQRYLSEPDLFSGTPAVPGDRALGVALGLLGPALATSAVLALLAAAAGRAGGFRRGSEGHAVVLMPSLAEWLLPVLLVVLAGVAGIFTAHLRRGRLPAVLVVVFCFLVVGTAGAWIVGETPLKWAHPVMFAEYEGRLPDGFAPSEGEAEAVPLRPPDEHTGYWREVHVDADAAAWHLVYVSGLIILSLWLTVRMASHEPGGWRPPGSVWLPRAGASLTLIGGAGQLLTTGAPG